MARSLTITYGSLTIGAGTNYHIDGNWRWDVDYRQGRLQATVVVEATSASQLDTRCSALEAAFRTPWQNLSLAMGGTTFLSYSHSGNTGFSGEASIAKSGTQTDTLISREYSITVTVYFPANLSGQLGRRDASISISHSPSDRLTIAFSGEWTALGGDDALEQYEENSKTWATDYLASKFSDRTFELLTDQVTPDDQDKVARFTMVYQEIIYNQSAGVLNDPELVGEEVSFSVARSTPGDSPPSSLASSLGLGGGSASRPYGVTAAISASVDKNETTDLDRVWTAKLRPYLLSQVQAATGVGGVIAVVDQSYDTDYANNVVSGSLTMVVTAGGLLSYEVSLAYNELTGTTPVWAHGDSNASAYIVQRERVLSRVVTVQYRSLTSAGAQGGGNAAAAGAVPAGGAGGVGGRRNGNAQAAAEIIGQINATFEDILGGGSVGGVGTSSPNVNEQDGGGGALRGGNNGGGGAEFGLDLNADGLSWVTTQRSGSSTPRILGDPSLRSFNVVDIVRSATQIAFAPIKIQRVPITQANRQRGNRRGGAVG